MNIAYFRKSNHSVEETTNSIIDQAAQKGWKVLETTTFPDGLGKMVLLCRPDWLKAVIAIDHSLIGFLPCGISVLNKNNEVIVGTGQPALLKALTKSEEILAMASQAEGELKELIHIAAGVGPLKVTGVKLYSTTTCPYCTLESKWLKENNIEFTEVKVDTDQEEAEKMVAHTGQMGVPVTEIIYEDSEPEFIVGFNRPQLEQLLTQK